MATPETDEQLEKAFKCIDKNGDNLISIQELKDYYAPMQEMLGMSSQLAALEIESLVKRLDTDHDGTISFEEFKKFMSEN